MVYRWQSLVLIDVSGSDYTNVLLTLSISCVLFTLADTSSPISYQLQSNPCEKAAINTKCHHIFRKFRAHPVLALWAIQTSLPALRLFTGTVPTSLSSVHQTFDSDSIHLPSAMPSLLCRRDLVQQHTASSIVSEYQNHRQHSRQKAVCTNSTRTLHGRGRVMIHSTSSCWMSTVHCPRFDNQGASVNPPFRNPP
jgi:hypothetical protein